MINIQENVILAPYTTFRIGGPAKYFVEVENEEGLKEALEYALKNNLKFFLLGGGSNILVSDNGFEGFAIKLKNDGCRVNGELIECGAGASLFKVVRWAADNALTGLEWAAGIPGTVGGAVRGNAGAFDGNMQGVVKEIKMYALEGGNSIISKEIYLQECEFEYRDSLFKKNNNLVIISAILKLSKGNITEIQKKNQ